MDWVWSRGCSNTGHQVKGNKPDSRRGDYGERGTTARAVPLAWSIMHHAVATWHPFVPSSSSFSVYNHHHLCTQPPPYVSLYNHPSVCLQPPPFLLSAAEQQKSGPLSRMPRMNGCSSLAWDNNNMPSFKEKHKAPFALCAP